HTVKGGWPSSSRRCAGRWTSCNEGAEHAGPSTHNGGDAMDRRLMQITVLAIVGVGAAAASQVPSPSGLLFMRVGRDRCHWVRAMPRLGMGRMGPKSLSCTVAGGIHVVMDSVGIGSDG